jgi:NADH-quinone oxidoreductase subunit I
MADRHFLHFPLGLFKSMKIAIINLFRPNMVIQYPHQRAIIPKRARFAVEIITDEAGNHRCTACKICEGACPDYIINLDIETAEDRSKFIKHWQYARGACMMCGLCVEACPFNAIRMGHDYELAHADPALLTYDLLTNVPAYVRPKPQPTPAPKPQPTSAPETEAPHA